MRRTGRGSAARGAMLALTLCLGACHGAGRPADAEWMQGPWLIEDATGAQRLESGPRAGGAAADDSTVMNVLSDVVYGPDASRPGSRVRIAPTPVLTDRRLGFRVSVRW